MSRITRNKQTHLSSKISFIKQVHDPIGSQNESVLISLEYKTFISLSPVVRLQSISHLDWNTHRETRDSIWSVSLVKNASANRLQRHFVMSMLIHIPAKIQSHGQETEASQSSWAEKRDAPAAQCVSLRPIWKRWTCKALFVSAAGFRIEG